ncbi:hypothetical protein TUBRATIS_23080 [Tubulinosema ratisbonensis]|uniref:Uncharacterized protein n=1 Tax=Tubulinosema ratisbonensis TaxID=291195 RepID=A0A437AJP4_9MICR|nr:hypothetical protein TUBRATIS_23080 [Tubulinosema ratisbonensis]
MNIFIVILCVSAVRYKNKKNDEKTSKKIYLDPSKLCCKCKDNVLESDNSIKSSAFMKLETVNTKVLERTDDLVKETEQQTKALDNKINTRFNERMMKMTSTSRIESSETDAVNNDTSRNLSDIPRFYIFILEEYKKMASYWKLELLKNIVRPDETYCKLSEDLTNDLLIDLIEKEEETGVDSPAVAFISEFDRMEIDYNSKNPFKSKKSVVELVHFYKKWEERFQDLYYGII